MSDPTSDERANRMLARMLGGRSRLPTPLLSTTRRLVRLWHRDKCHCGHASLVPGCHAPACPYRLFWQEAANAK